MERKTLQHGTETTTTTRRRQRQAEKMYVGVHMAKKKGEGKWKTTQKHPAAIQLFNFGDGGRKRGQIRVSERLILICDWLGETETGYLYHKSQQRREKRKQEERRGEVLQYSPKEAFTVVSQDYAIHCTLKTKKAISMPFTRSIHVENKGWAHTVIPQVINYLVFT